MKRRIAFALIMSMVTTIVISFTIIAVNLGFVSNFLMIWFRSWCLSYLLAFLATIFLAPRIQSFVDILLKRSSR